MEPEVLGPPPHLPSLAPPVDGKDHRTQPYAVTPWAKQGSSSAVKPVTALALLNTLITSVKTYDSSGNDFNCRYLNGSGP
ncbi:hypothetical protein ACWEO1_39160 [Kitasatospora cineracea]